MSDCPVIVCVAQASETLGRRGGKGGSGESLYGSCDPPLSKNQADSVRHDWHSCHGGCISGSGEWGKKQW